MKIVCFRYFNNDEEFFGDHNRDENGEIDLPVTVAIETVDPDPSSDDNSETEDDEEGTIVVIDEDNGEQDDDVYEDAIEEPNVPHDDECDKGRQKKKKKKKQRSKRFLFGNQSKVKSRYSTASRNRMTSNGSAASANGEGGDDFGPSDEVKVFNNEGEDEREEATERTIQEELLQEKTSLITESEKVRNSYFHVYLRERSVVRCE